MTGVHALLLLGLAAGPAQSSAESKEQPNLVASVSAALIEAIVRRPVDRLQPVEEEIVKTMFFGISRTCAEVHAELVPDPSHGAVEIVMRGGTRSLSTGYRGSVTVQTATEIPFEVRKL